MSDTPIQTAPAGWHPDPLERYGFRFWNARHWTAYCMSGDGFHFDRLAASLYSSESRSKLYSEMHVDLGRKMAHLTLNDHSISWGDVVVPIGDIRHIAIWQTPGKRREDTKVAITIWHGAEEFHIDVRYRDFPPETRDRLGLALAGLANGLDQRVYPWVAAQVVGHALEGEEERVGTMVVSRAGLATAGKLPWPRTRAFLAWDDIASCELIDDDIVVWARSTDASSTTPPDEPPARREWGRMSSTERNAPTLPLVVDDVKLLRRLLLPEPAPRP